MLVLTTWLCFLFLRVADYHTYFVGGEEWGFSVWAHNAARAYGVNVDNGSYIQLDQGKLTVTELRRRYLGETPRPGSKVWKETVARMKAENKIRENPTTKQLELKGVVDGKEVWRPLSGGGVNLGHRVDAVKWWNEEGRFYGARSKEAYIFMRTSSNYEFQFEGPNKRAGALMRHHEDAEYLAPPIASLKIVSG